MGEQGANGTGLVPGPEKASGFLEGNLVHVVGAEELEGSRGGGTCEAPQEPTASDPERAPGAL